MNIRDIVVPALLAFAIVTGVRYFFEPQERTEQVVSGRKRIIPASEDLVKPLDKHVNFIDLPVSADYTETKVTTNNGYYVFTTQGAGLKQAYFKLDSDNNDDQYLCAFNSTNVNFLAFLLALNIPTPVDYKLISHNVTDLETELVYQASSTNGLITKKFVISSQTNNIDLFVNLDSKDSDTQFRLFIPTPGLCGVSEDTIFGLVNTQSSSTKIKEINKDESQAAWDIPKIFGSESRYFASVVYSQDGDRAQRGSFKLENENLITVLETPRIKGTAEWSLKCYFGPKRADSLELVDKRLTQILNYGWFSVISKALLSLLNILFKYVKNYGLAIILLTLLLKLALLPISWKGEDGLKRQAELDKKMSYISQKFRNDPEALQREQLELLRKNGMGLSGLLPNLIQFPFIIALQRVLANSIELYEAPFFWIPNLAAPDPYGVLSVLFGLAAFLGFAKSKASIKKQLMPLGLTAVFISFTLKLSAGLVLAIFINVFLSQLQSYVYRKIKK